MIEILTALSVLFIVSVYFSNGYSFNFVIGCFLPILVILSGFGLVAYAALAWGYFAAGYQVDIINREYQTNYTQLEMFYASDVIETVRELQRKRLEVNGNLLPQCQEPRS